MYLEDHKKWTEGFHRVKIGFAGTRVSVWTFEGVIGLENKQMTIMVLETLKERKRAWIKLITPHHTSSDYSYTIWSK